MSNKARAFEITWPLFQGEKAQPFSEDPAQPVKEHAPTSADLVALCEDESLPETTEASEQEVRRLRDSLPPPTVAPDWMRAAQALITGLQALVERGSVEPHELVAVARTWAAWSLAGVAEPQVLRVAHLVSRAHAALRELTQTGPELHARLRAAAGVLHSGLPASVRERMPLQRVVYLVYQLREFSDPWRAVVEGTAELLGWKDYARAHAAAAISAMMARASTRTG